MKSNVFRWQPDWSNSSKATAGEYQSNVFNKWQKVQISVFLMCKNLEAFPPAIECASWNYAFLPTKSIATVSG